VVLVTVREVEKQVVWVEAGKEAVLIEVLQVVVLQVGVVQKQRDQSYED
jgi:hypothetical protein